MRIDIATLFPEMCERVLSESIIGRARQRGYIELACHQIRDYTTNRQKQVDDYPYGGGPGMVMQAQPIYDCCVDVIRQMEEAGHARPHVVFMTAAGTPLTEEKCKQLAQKDSLLLVCGHYEGIDERVIEALADEEISIGDYVLTGGELAALVVADSVCRLCPGVLSSRKATRRRAITAACLSIPSTAARRNGTAAACRRSCFQATMQTSQNGGMNRHWSARAPAVRIYTRNTKKSQWRK